MTNSNDYFLKLKSIHSSIVSHISYNNPGAIIDIYLKNKDLILLKSTYALIARAAAYNKNEKILDEVLTQHNPNQVFLETIFASQKNWRLLKKYSYYEFKSYTKSAKFGIVDSLLVNHQDEIFIYLLQNKIIKAEKAYFILAENYENFKLIENFAHEDFYKAKKIYQSIVDDQKIDEPCKLIFRNILLKNKLETNLQIKEKITHSNKI